MINNRDLREIDYNASQCINATAKHPVCFAIRCRCCGLHHFNFPQALSRGGLGHLPSIICLSFRFVLQTIKAKTNQVKVKNRITICRRPAPVKNSLDCHDVKREHQKCKPACFDAPSSHHNSQHQSIHFFFGANDFIFWETAFFFPPAVGIRIL